MFTVRGFFYTYSKKQGHLLPTHTYTMHTAEVGSVPFSLLFKPRHDCLPFLFEQCRFLMVLWFLQNFRIHVGVSSLNICLLNNVHENHKIINLIIILAKKHIYKQRLENRKPRIDLFLSEVRCYYLLEKSIYKNNSKSTLFEKKWNAELTKLN